MEAILSPLFFPWPTFPQQKSIKIHKTKKIPLESLKLHPPPWPKRKKERGKGEEEGGWGGRRERRSQKNSKEKNGCQFKERN